MIEYEIDEYFEFHLNTQTPGTGAAVDADALPTWRCYEENNDTAEDSGNCAKREDGSTTGYYIARGQCTTALGYEVGKKYIVRVAAIVGGVTGAAPVGMFEMVTSDVAREGADSDTLETLSDQIDGTSTHTAANVWAVGTRTLTSVGTLVADTAAAVWEIATSGLTTVGSIGKLLVDNINAAISSRATPAQVATELGTYDGPTKAEMDAAFAALMTAADVNAEVDSALADYDGPTEAEMNTAHALLATEGADGDTLETLSDQIDGVATHGAGAITAVYTLYVTDTTTPIVGVDVWITSDVGGATSVAGPLQTNGSGQVTFYLDAGTYYVWRQKAGYNFDNPQTWEVS